ncbi:MAG: esterase-like activity of phytase family protein [Shimia sp.]|uniref:esterase-like activity of phytase family protein n=1 Tax=Shimia sp. TaxID=1954381 RepID=UPI004059F823
MSFLRAGEHGHSAELIATYRWQIPETWFGGFSALELSDDGTEMVALSDRGFIVQAQLQRKDGEITGVTNVRTSRVLRPSGHFARHTGWRDSEGLAQMDDGSLVVAFEGEHRLERFAYPGALPQQIPWSEEFNEMKLNGGFEALAVDANGALFVMPEVATGPENLVQVFTLEGKIWRRAFTLTRDKQFQPVGADFGPDGRLYVLERGFNGFGFRTRLRSFEVTANASEDESVLFINGVGVQDNLEGLSVWRDIAGQIRLTLISDDNFRLLQRTEIVEYVLPNSS